MEKKIMRSSNFTLKEEEVLIMLVKKYKNQIECKKCDSNANLIKSNAWVKLSKEYNSMWPDFHRDVKVLKNKYENIKKRSKKKYADQKSYIRGTGGGPQRDITLTSVDNSIYEIIGSQLTGLTSEFDDDAVEGNSNKEEDCDDSETLQANKEFRDSETALKELNWTTVTPTAFKTHKEKQLNNISSPISKSPEFASISAYSRIEENDEVDIESAESNKDPERVLKEINWSKLTPAALKTPKSKELVTDSTAKKTTYSNAKKTTSNLSNKLEEWASSKNSLAQLQADCFLKEHELKIEHMKEKHEQEMKYNRIEAENKIMYLKKEHEARIEAILARK